MAKRFKIPGMEIVLPGSGEEGRRHFRGEEQAGDGVEVLRSTQEKGAGGGRRMQEAQRSP